MREQIVQNLENQIQLKNFKLNSLLDVTNAINLNRNVDEITRLFEFILREQLGFDHVGRLGVALDEYHVSFDNAFIGTAWLRFSRTCGCSQAIRHRLGGRRCSNTGFDW